MSDPKTAAIVVAAGLGTRFGGTVKKQFQNLFGKPVLSYSIEVLESSSTVEEIVLVVPDDSLAYSDREIIARFGFKKITKIIPGGKERRHSVERGFNSLSDKIDVVLIHDGVRPFINNRMVEEVIKEASISGGAIVAIPVKDTVKRSSPTNYIETTISRESLWLAQTPQAFRHDVLRTAYEKLEDGFIFTDESSLIERLGIRVKLVKGSEFNIKITTEEDLLLGELIFREGIYKRDVQDRDRV
ncbi:MAG: 2-C-methyl-D-erythritol 4-phosphate cytidylyltransferase [Thermodesulfobacteriota bacterium]